MEVGDKATFKFGKAKRKMEGTIIRLFPKTVYLKVEFPDHKRKIYRDGKLIRQGKNNLEKIVKRKRYQLEV